jgi:hypothetical protein
MKLLIFVVLLCQDATQNLPASAQSLIDAATGFLNNTRDGGKPTITDPDSTKSSTTTGQGPTVWPPLPSTKEPYTGARGNQLPGCQMQKQKRTLRYGNCSFSIPVKTCEGYCSSGTVSHSKNYEKLRATSLKQTCSCCQPVAPHSRTIRRNCNGNTIQIIYIQMRRCDCHRCVTT